MSKQNKKPQNNTFHELRKSLHLNQCEFWNAVGYTQSAGSRYEHGRTPHKSVPVLIELVHQHGINIMDPKVRKKLVKLFNEHEKQNAK